jgi:hypothetical protein
MPPMLDKARSRRESCRLAYQSHEWSAVSGQYKKLDPVIFPAFLKITDY